jgi:hypothetical protein
MNDDLIIENDLPPGLFIPERADLQSAVTCCQMLLTILHNLYLDSLLTPFEIELIGATAQVVRAVKFKYDIKEV